MVEEDPELSFNAERTAEDNNPSQDNKPEQDLLTHQELTMGLDLFVIAVHPKCYVMISEEIQATIL